MIDKFMAEYDKQLIVAIEKYPNEYCYPVNEAPTVSRKMREAFIRKSYNKDGRAIKATCKALNIPYTYTGINEFISK